ncbi:MAG: carbamoyltransferase N-terminal domain-containing protein, partial [Pseudohongiellaceae bacterium]
MALITLGLAGAIGYDSAAAIFIDGELVAAVEEERLVRRKHAKGMMPYHAARFCMQYAQIKAKDVNVIAIPYAPVSLLDKGRWHYARRHWYAPDRSLDVLLNGNRRYRRYLHDLKQLLENLHIAWNDVRIEPVQHQLAHASSGYLMNAGKEKAAILSIDRKGEYATIFLGYGENGKIHKLKQFYDPDSLSGMYAAITDYLGFDMLDGEYKVMGMAPFGDPFKYDLSALADYDGKHFSLNTRLIGTVGLRRYKAKSRGHFFSQKLLDLLGPRREGNLVDDPYVHYAAAIQKLYEDITVAMVIHYLSGVLGETGRLVFTGTSSLNIKLNERLLALPQVKELIVHPACGDAGTAIGAAAYSARRRGMTVEPLKHLFLGPKYSTSQCISACRNHRDKPIWEELENAPRRAAELLAQGELVGWFQGRMEFGQRALGNRSILANPAQEKIVDILNR